MTAADLPRRTTTAELEQALTAGVEADATRPRLTVTLAAAVRWAAPRAGRLLLRFARGLLLTGLWVLRECVTFARDLGGLVNRLCRIDDRVLLWLAGLAVAAGIAGYIAVYRDVVSARLVIGGAVAVYAGLATLTAVPRARHHIRRTLHYAVHSVAGRGDSPRSHAKVPKARRVRWRCGTRQLKRADIPVPLSWQHGKETNRDTLGDEIAWRLAPYGPYHLTWPAGQPMARVRRTVLLPTRIDAQDWRPPAGLVLLGVTEAHHPRAVRVEKRLYFAGWSRKSNPHMLFAGETGNGKTAGVRWMTRAVRAAAEAAGRNVVFGGLDGKGAGNLAYLLGREGVLGVGDEPREWIDLTHRFAAEMGQRYAALRAWRRGEGPRPYWDTDWILFADELVDIYDQCGDGFMDPFGQIARLGREAGVYIIASVLRPDVAESIPGLIRAQLNARLLLGALHDQKTAEMMFGPQAKKAQRLSDEEDDDIQGRGIARLGGRMYRVQLPYVNDPAEDRAGAETWLPRKLATVTPLPINRPDDEQRGPAGNERAVIDGEVINIDGAGRPRRRGNGVGPVDLTGGED